MTRPLTAPRPVGGYAFIVAGLTAVIALALLYPAWLGLFRLPRVEESLRATSMPQVLTTTVELLPLPTGGASPSMPVLDTVIRSSLSYAVLEVPVPSLGREARHEVVLTDARGIVLWNQTQLQSYEGRVRLLISPRAMAPGAYTLRSVTTSYSHSPQVQIAKFQIEP